MRVVFHRGWNGVKAGTVAADVDLKTVTSKVEGEPGKDIELQLQFLVDGIRDGTLQVEKAKEESPSVAKRLAEVSQRKSRKPEVAVTDE